MEVLDCIVVGLGAHGSSCIAKLAQENKKVLGLEKFTRVHTKGSSHGRSRIIRQAYFEDPRYVPLVKRSFELWRELAEFESNEGGNGTTSLLNVCGGLMIGSRDSEIISGTLEAAQLHNLPHEILSAAEIRKRFPVLTPSDDLMGVYETEAGYLIPEACIEAHLQLAEKHGARLNFEESLASWNIITDEELEGLISVTTDRNITYLTRKLVLAVGAWAPELYGDQIPISLQCERRVLFWFKPLSDDKIVIEQFRELPVFLWDNSTESDICQFYGFPPELTGSYSECIKVAKHQTVLDSRDSAHCTPDTIMRSVSSSEVSTMRQLLEGKVAGLSCGTVTDVETCMYTMTEDENFLIDFHPMSKNVILASPCSGHGFKFSAVIGEILKDLVVHGECNHNISLFSIESRIKESNL